jgi:hypothetical protein
MIKKEDYDKAKELIKNYETEQLNLLRVMRSKSATTSIPQEKWGVHRTHCCFDHGCKYGDKDCPVELGLIKQDYKCEYCD